MVRTSAVTGAIGAASIIGSLAIVLTLPASAVADASTVAHRASSTAMVTTW
jgi:hypothetical protein